MILLLAAFAALGGAPDSERREFSVASGELSDGSVSADGALVVFVADSSAHVLNVSTWSDELISNCVVSAAAVGLLDGEHQVWIGCEDGSVRPFTYQDGILQQITETGQDEEQTLVSVDVLDGTITSMHWSSTYDRLYVVAERTEGGPYVVGVVDPSTREVSATINLAYTGYSTSVMGAEYLFIAHGDSRISTVFLGSNAASINTQGLVIDIDNMAATSRGTTWVADRETGQIAEYLPNSTSYGFTAVPVSDDLQAIGVSVDLDDEYALVAGDFDLDVYAMSGGTVQGTEPIATFPVSGAYSDIVVGTGGYAFAGSRFGSIYVLSSNPWIEGVQLDSQTVRDGDQVTVSFSTDQAGSWQVVVGGGWRSGGTVVASGVASEAGDVQGDFTVGAWSEGDNSLWVRLTNGDGDVGHGATTVVVDSPPLAVQLADGAVGFGDGKLSLSFDALDAEDIDVYTVYVTTTPFEASDFLTGGPEYEGPDELVAPVLVTHVDGERLVAEIAPVTNDTIYYIAVRATDKSGGEGPMSDVVEGRPRPTKSASELAGEEGGADCSSTGAPMAWFLGLSGLGLVALRRRRRWLPAAGVALLAGSLAVSTDASAADDDNRDMTPARGHFEIRYGTINMVDESITAVHGETGNNVLQVEVGPQFYRFLELDLGTGLFRETNPQIDDAGEPGEVDTRLSYIPLTVGGTFRLHLLDEQIAVPFVSYGFDWVFWSEVNDPTSEDKERMTGTKRGTHWAVGGSILLDTFDRSRASLLEAQSGINDSWVTFEYRKQRIEGDEGFDFSGSSFTVGLKLDF